MATNTIIDYEKDNQYLPQNIRAFIGQNDRVLVQVFDAFFSLFDKNNKRILYNNWMSAKFASGMTRLNYSTIRSGVAPRLLKIKVDKTVGKVYYQAPEGTDEKVDQLLPKDYLSKKLYEAFTKAEKTGRCLMTLYKDESKEENKPYIVDYDAFRHELVFDNAKNIIEARMFLIGIDDQRMNFAKYYVVEKRYYKNGKPYQKMTVRFQSYTNEAGNDVKLDINEVETKDIPKWLKDKFMGISFNVERELENYTDLGVYHIDCTAINSKFPDSDIPEAMFIDALDTIVMAEQGLTDKEVEKEIGRGQILMPEFGKQFEKPVYNATPTNQTAIAKPIMFAPTQKNPVIQTYPTMKMEDSKPTNVQFEFRPDQWGYSVNDDIARLCAIVGISIMDFDPRLLQTGQRTDDEINAMTDITTSTVTTTRNLNEHEINKMLACICVLYGLKQPVTIKWSMASILNPQKNAMLITQLLTSGLISRKEAIKRTNPDLNDNEINELYNEIKEELGQETEKTIIDAYNNF